VTIDAAGCQKDIAAQIGGVPITLPYLPRVSTTLTRTRPRT
jgi:hypothetical protein